MAALQDPKQMVTVTQLDDLLQCPVCYEVPAGHIYQCNQGHHVCGDCKSRIDLCPVCRSMFFGTRNYAMEELISNIQKLKLSKSQPEAQTTKSNKGSATTSTTSSETTLGLTDTDRTDNMVETRLAPTMCAGLFRCLCCNNERKERLPVARMLNHLRYWHSLDLIEGKLEGEQYEQAWQIPMDSGRIVIAVRVVELGIFFLVVEIRSDSYPMELHSWLSMVATPLEADGYTYNLTLTGSDREATFSDTAISVRSCEGQLKKRRRCLVLDNANIRAFYESQIVSVRLCIKRALERRDELRSEPRAALRIANRSSSDAGSTHSINSPDRLFDREIVTLGRHIQNQNAANVQLHNVVQTPPQPARNAAQQPPQNGASVPYRVGIIQVVENPPARNGILQSRNAIQNELHPSLNSVQNEAPLSRNARRRLRRRLNVNAQFPSLPLMNQSRAADVEYVGYAQGAPVNIGRPPVAPPVTDAAPQTGARQPARRNRRSRARR